jgi:hypothetical protein
LYRSEAYLAAEPKLPVEASSVHALRRLFMKPLRRIAFMLATILMVTAFANAPAIAQQDDAAALDKRVAELRRVGKYSEAIPLAQRALAIWEKALGPDHPDVARELNDLAELYRAQALCVPKTLSGLMMSRDRLNWRDDRASLFHAGRPRLPVQVEVAA